MATPRNVSGTAFNLILLFLDLHLLISLCLRREHFPWTLIYHWIDYNNPKWFKIIMTSIVLAYFVWVHGCFLVRPAFALHLRTSITLQLQMFTCFIVLQGILLSSILTTKDFNVLQVILLLLCHSAGYTCFLLGALTDLEWMRWSVPFQRSWTLQEVSQLRSMIRSILRKLPIDKFNLTQPNK